MIAAANAQAAGAVLLGGRLLLAWLFLHEGAALAAHPGEALAAMARLGVPAPFAAAAILLQLGAGAAVALGWRTRPAAGALALFCLSTALLFHRELRIRNELLHFEKDLGLAGGLLLLALSGPGPWSLDALRAFALTRRLAAAPGRPG